jgi:hypothetical protein
MSSLDWLYFDRVIVDRFFRSDGRDRYFHILQYILTGFSQRASPLCTRASLPGLPSSNGDQIDQMEAFSRVAPLLAAWIFGGGPNEIETLQGKTIDLKALLSTALAAATDPSSPEYWGPLRDNDQRVCEAADLAITLWLSRDWIGKYLSANSLAKVNAWLTLGIDRVVKRNNWDLFPCTIAAVLQALQCPVDDEKIRMRVDRIRHDYIARGLFRDGPNGRVDYYTAWAYHYHLSFLQLITPALKLPAILKDRRDITRILLHLISPRGIPIMGRSVHYRLAVPAPLIMCILLDDSHIRPGQARRALDAVWEHFVARGALKSGRITQGYYKDDEIWLDTYSGPASPLWSLRSIIPALMLPHTHFFWRTSPVPLPIEAGDFHMPLCGKSTYIKGSHTTQEIRIVRESAVPVRKRAVRPIKLLRALRYRPDKSSLRYDLPEYSCLHPFCTDSSSLELFLSVLRTSFLRNSG